MTKPAYVNDWFDVDRLCQKGLVDSQVEVLSDFWSNFATDMPLAKVHCMPAKLMLDNIEIEHAQKYIKTFDNTVRHPVNAYVNLVYLNKHLTLKLIEVFDLDCAYFWSGLGNKHDLGTVVKELQTGAVNITPSQQTQLLKPAQLPMRWFYQSNDLHPVAMRHARSLGSPWLDYLERMFKFAIGKPNRSSHISSWNNGLGSTMSATTVSLITESDCDRSDIRAVSFSWKTIFSVLANTLPIWIGGHGAADAWRSMGFDVFDDIVNHDYQYAPTLFQRSWQAVSLNQKLLHDVDRLRKLKQDLKPRFAHNQKLIFDKVIVKHWLDRFCEWPIENRRLFWQQFKKHNGFEVSCSMKFLKQYTA
jgi:hypothetical protein